MSPPLAVPHATYVTGRGPFSEADDRALLRKHKINAIVCKNSGGEATYGKIAAARSPAIEVIMIKRPQMQAVDTVDAVLAWLDHAEAV